MKARLRLPVLLVVFLATAASTSFVLQKRHPPAEDATGLLLRLSGALRVFIEDGLWMRMRVHQYEGKENLVLSDARTLLLLNPKSDRIRAFLHWHLVFNMARKAATEIERAEWVREGLDLMEVGLAQNPDSPLLNREMGMTFFLRSQAAALVLSATQEQFRRICFERHGAYPVQLAPLFFEKAYETLGDQDTFLFFMTSLLNAASDAAARKAHAEAAALWSKVLEHLSPWLEAFENEEDRAALIQYYRDHKEYCSLMSSTADPAGNETGDAERIRVLRRRIETNRFHDAWEEEDR